MNGPKIIYHHRTAAEDGQAVHIRAMLRALKGVGATVHEVGLVQRGTSAPAPTAASNATAAGTGDAKASSARSWSFMRTVPRFARELMEYGYSGVARRKLLAAARDLEPDLIYERYAFGNAGGIAAAKRLGVPIILEVNSPLVDELERTRGLSFRGLARRSERFVLENADRVCAVTHVLADMLVDLGAPRERIFVTPNGVHPDQYAAADDADARRRARRDLGLAELDDSALVLGFTGYYRDWHRLDLVVEALTDPGLRDAHLVLIGEGPARESLEDAGDRCGVRERVHFTGPRSHDAIPELLCAFDVGLVPAINPYASPLKLHEYMAAGLPSVAPDQPNLREVLEHERESLLVAPGDGDALRHALVRLAGDPSLRGRLGLEARRQIELQGLTWRANALRVLDEARALGAVAG